MGQMAKKMEVAKGKDGGMRCPKCGERTVVAQTRVTETTISRRRHCAACPFRFTTHEVVI